MSGLLEAAHTLSVSLAPIPFGPPVTHVYNPLVYAAPMYEAYVQRFGQGPKRVIFLGMNPGPWGMAQTGVPFGQVDAVRDWLRLEAPIHRPANEHPKRPVLGLAGTRAEVSGQRFWGAMAARFGTPEAFFAEHFVLNYCPLLFLEESGRNRTPEQLPASERTAIADACDAHLRAVVAALAPEWIIGIGNFAEARAAKALGPAVRIGRITHPSPANPAANRDWAGAMAASLVEQGVWTR